MTIPTRSSTLLHLEGFASHCSLGVILQQRRRFPHHLTITSTTLRSPPLPQLLHPCPRHQTLLPQLLQPRPLSPSFITSTLVYVATTVAPRTFKVTASNARPVMISICANPASLITTTIEAMHLSLLPQKAQLLSPWQSLTMATRKPPRRRHFEQTLLESHSCILQTFVIKNSQLFPPPCPWLRMSMES